MVSVTAMVYFHFVIGNDFTLFFVIAKNKVAPTKIVCIPRFERCATVLLAKLMSYVLKVFNRKRNFSQIVAWSNSQTALAWIKSQTHCWKVFVSNRIFNVQELIPAEN